MTVDELLADLERQASEADEISATAPVACVLRSVCQRLAGIDRQTVPVSRRDRLMSVQEAAERSGMTERWFYDNRRKLSFVKKMSHRQIRVSERGFERWLSKL